MKPTLIIIDGQNGAGKSTVAKLLHAKLKNTAVIHWDVIKKLVSDFKPTVRNHKIAAEVSKAMAKTYLQNKVSVIYETYFGKAEYVKGVAHLADGKKVKLFIYQIEAHFDTRFERVKERHAKGEKRRKLLTKARMIRNDKYYFKYKSPHARVIDSTSLSPNKIVVAILKDIK